MNSDPLKDEPGGLPPAPQIMDLLVTLALVGVTAGTTFWGHAALPADMVPLVFMMAVLIAALAFGFWAGLVAAVTAFGALNFLFTDPLFTFDVARLPDLTALVVFLIVAGLAGLLAGRLHDQAGAARARAEVLGVLSDLSSALAAVRSTQEALSVALHPLERLCGGAALILTQSDVGPAVVLPAGAPLDPATQAAAERAFRTGQGEPASAPGWPGSRFSLLPLTDGMLVGHAALSGREAPRRALAIGALIQQTRLALQRLDFAAKAEAERLRAEAEATRAAVLTSLGHDLRTPLATILGAASALKDLDAQLTPAARHDLLLAIEEEAGRLNIHVSNLMQLSRLELTAAPRRDWVDLNDSVIAAAARARRAVKGAQVQETLASLPMIRSAGGLIEQAVFNLIDNALTHGRGAVRIATEAEGGVCSVTVRDQGPGLPPAVAAWLAEPEARPAPGQRGLGLAVAKGIARHLGGTLSWTDGAIRLTLPEAL